MAGLMIEADETAAAPVDFLIARGGPFYRLQVRLRLLRDNAPAAGRRAVLFAALAWLPLALLSAVQGAAIGDFDQQPFLLDVSAYARFIVAVAVFVLMEPLAEQRLRVLTLHFVDTGLLPPAERPAAAAAIARALRRRDAGLAELVVLAAAYALAYAGVMNGLVVATMPASWLGTVRGDGSADLSLAGWWCLLVSAPLFFFLLGGWIWRIILWALLLRDLARLNLQLVATHPDRAGGLAFIGQYPQVFAGFVFALSCVVAAVAARAILYAGVDFDAVVFVIGAWLALIVVLFALPLTAFIPPLARLKKRALLEYGTLAGRHNRAFERRWLRGGGGNDEDLLGVPEISSLADLAIGYEAVRRMSPLPVSKQSVLLLAIAALVPMLAVGVTQMPIADLLKIVSGLLL